MEIVRSSNIYKIGYDAKSKELSIIFVSSPFDRYVYLNVPAQIWTSLQKSVSKGIYFADNIKNSYSFIKSPYNGTY